MIIKKTKFYIDSFSTENITDLGIIVTIDDDYLKELVLHWQADVKDAYISDTSIWHNFRIEVNSDDIKLFEIALKIIKQANVCNINKNNPMEFINLLEKLGFEYYLKCI